MTEQAQTPPAMRSVRIQNLIRACAAFQAMLHQISLQEPASSLRAAQPEIALLLDRVRTYATQVEEICVRHDGNPAELPTPSRRAYQWLKYLSVPENLLAQIATMAEARQIIAQMQWLKDGEFARYAVTFELSHGSYLYNSRPAGETIRISAAQGFSGAPPNVLEALIRASLSRRQRTARALVTAYTSGEDYAETALGFELAAELPQPDVRGRHHDLTRSFERVNAKYFAGRLTPPRLTWSQSITQRLMGYYLAERDTLMVSLTLDRADVPAHVVDYVMYHELLHRVLGVPLVDGRRRPHGRAFREAEQRYEGYAAADAFLKQLAHSAHRARRH